MDYVFTKSPVAVDRLSQEIKANTSITVVLNSISVFGVQVTCSFRAGLTLDEQDELDAVIAAHSGQPLPAADPTVIVSKQPDPAPFAQPTFRTKRDATPDIITIVPGETEDIDFLLTAERYVSGGVMIIEGAEFGDYVTAEVSDCNGVLPEAYRASLCEAWPIVARYVEREYIEVSNGVYTKHEIDTAPLNAKITAGLCLRVSYHAVNSGSNRRLAVNYRLTRKL